MTFRVTVISITRPLLLAIFRDQADPSSHRLVRRVISQSSPVEGNFSAVQRIDAENRASYLAPARAYQSRKSDNLALAHLETDILEYPCPAQVTDAETTLPGSAFSLG